MGKMMMAMALAVLMDAGIDVRTQERLNDGQVLALFDEAKDAVRRTLLPAATNAELKALLTEVLGGFENHLAETRRVAEALGVR